MNYFLLRQWIHCLYNFATKHLPNYLGWRIHFDEFHNQFAPAIFLFHAGRGCCNVLLSYAFSAAKVFDSTLIINDKLHSYQC